MDNRPNVILISIDALKPEIVFNSDTYDVDVSHLKNLVIENGAYASQGMKSVFPAFTYACHQSMITGTYPDKHGTYSNSIFDPMGVHLGAWYWCVSDKVENLWELASQNGYVSASMAFPTSVGAKGDFIAPEFWFDGTPLDSHLIDALAHPQGLIKEMEAEIGVYPGGLDLSPEGDRKRFEGARFILQNKLAPFAGEIPFFLSLYFASYDEMAHVHGVHSKEALDTLSILDDYIGELVSIAKNIVGDNLVVCLVSDHGTIDNTHNIHPNVVFFENGLIKATNGKVTDWDVWSHRSGGTAEVRLKDPTDSKIKKRVEEILRTLEKDPNSGIEKLLTHDEAVNKRHGFSLCDFVILAKRGYEIRDDFDSSYVTEKVTQKAQHGFDENYEEMLAFYGIAGPRIPKNHDLGHVQLVDVMPTLASVMGFIANDAQGEILF